MKAANGRAMMFGIHGAEEVSGGFVFGLFLSAAPMHKQAVAQTAEHSDHPHGAGQTHAALIIQVGDIQPLVQAAFDAPGGAIILEPLARLEFCGEKARHQGYGFRAVVPQVAAQQRDLFDAGKVDLFGGGPGGAQGAGFELPFVELTAARQRRRCVLPEKKRRAAR